MQTISSDNLSKNSCNTCLIFEAKEVGFGVNLLVELKDGASWEAKQCETVVHHRTLFAAKEKMKGM